ncbi:hypothetical protein BGW36DRAFT_195429 [Talaromyces proteolyticus]|uniref:Uncharacterized protein n=1 Tax=Talaromyces proteolyticus TaxID=1131652 RepID=A0AAD4KM87_9EURO|nr:uncharacterized protein BGW36DRAFT_195429 [Talaromyces proteolyticus]KAH8695011.1 hypothetical protein BGW36DRAFT_195429 [Talaromyces proteolyticus]
MCLHWQIKQIQYRRHTRTPHITSMSVNVLTIAQLGRVAIGQGAVSIDSWWIDQSIIRLSFPPLPLPKKDPLMAWWLGGTQGLLNNIIIMKWHNDIKGLGYRRLM